MFAAPTTCRYLAMIREYESLTEASILQLRLLGDDSRGRALSVIFQIRVTLNRVGESSSDISYFPGEAIATGSGSGTFERRKSRPGFPRSAVAGCPWLKPRPLAVDYGGQGWSNVDAALELAARWASARSTAGDAGLPWRRLKPPADPQTPFRSFLPK
ncbi:hypothetical protein MJT46_018082 [Ovis ammon polii x Ovis aries]|nr:hypothetical protein MJT46_018082 [Ovis ammon polii x Ovis aries]